MTNLTRADVIEALNTLGNNTLADPVAVQAYERLLQAFDTDVQRERIQVLEGEAKRWKFHGEELEKELERVKAGQESEELAMFRQRVLDLGKVDDDLHSAQDKIATLERELHEARTQCGKNAVSHMMESQRADRLQAKLTELEGEA